MYTDDAIGSQVERVAKAEEERLRRMGPIERNTHICARRLDDASLDQQKAAEIEENKARSHKSAVLASEVTLLMLSIITIYGQCS